MNDPMLGEKITTVARAYTIFVSPWLHADAFSFNSCPDINPNVPARYADAQLMRQARAAELYTTFPPELHPWIATAPSGSIQGVSAFCA